MKTLNCLNSIGNNLMFLNRHLSDTEMVLLVSYLSNIRYCIKAFVTVREASYQYIITFLLCFCCNFTEAVLPISKFYCHLATKSSVLYASVVHSLPTLCLGVSMIIKSHSLQKTNKYFKGAKSVNITRANKETNHKWQR